jgi:integrase
MAIQHRPGQPKAWRVYWNNPYTGKRQSVSFESKQEAEKHDSLIKHQLKFEKERFQPQEQQEPQKEKNDNSLEGLFYIFLKEKQFNRKGLEWQLDGMKKALILIGRKSVTAITKADMAHVLQSETESGVKPVTVRKHMSVLYSLLRWCVKRGHLDHLPPLPELPPKVYEKFIPPTPEEVQRILKSAAPHVQRVVIIGAKLGLRIGPCELFKLRWEDIDLPRALVRVRAARKNPKEPYREVPIMESLVRLFAVWQEEDAKKGIPHVIHFNGKPVLSVNRAWNKALERAGITRRIRPYDLRHAFATDAIGAGADIGTVSRLMGHASVQMVLQHYQHVATRQKREAIAALPEVPFEHLSCACGYVPNRKQGILQ